MNWKTITTEKELEELKIKSSISPVLIFKHSTRCSISGMVKVRLERTWNDEEMQELQPILIDLIKYRDLSSLIAEVFGVSHESPQAMIIKNGISIYDSSHMGISYDKLREQIK